MDVARTPKESPIIALLAPAEEEKSECEDDDELASLFLMLDGQLAPQPPLRNQEIKQQNLVKLQENIFTLQKNLTNLQENVVPQNAKNVLQNVSVQFFSSENIPEDAEVEISYIVAKDKNGSIELCEKNATTFKIEDALLDQFKKEKNTEEESQSGSQDKPQLISDLSRKGGGGKDFMSAQGKQKGESPFPNGALKSATERMIDLSAVLQARGGGTAKVQIQDDKIGKIELQIHMRRGNEVSFDLRASSQDFQNELIKNVDFLKKSLETQNINLVDFKVSPLEANKSANNNPQWSGQNPQQAFDQPRQGFEQGHSEQGKHHQNSQDSYWNENLTNKEPAQRSLSSQFQNLTVKNIRRSSDGSIEVSA